MYITKRQSIQMKAFLSLFRTLKIQLQKSGTSERFFFKALLNHSSRTNGSSGNPGNTGHVVGRTNVVRNSLVSVNKKAKRGGKEDFLASVVKWPIVRRIF